MTCENIVELPRLELYERVWTTPVIALASEYGLSNVGLAKFCKKHHIPRPGLGYWAKKKHGKSVRRTRLPSIEDGKLSTIRIFSRKRVGKSTISDSEIAQLILQESLPERAIVVRKQTQIRHPIIKAIIKAIFLGLAGKERLDLVWWTG